MKFLPSFQASRRTLTHKPSKTKDAESTLHCSIMDDEYRMVIYFFIRFMSIEKRFISWKKGNFTKKMHEISFI